jgi:pyruvate,water dikinase
MAETHATLESILRDLTERAKELNCLYSVEELTSREDLPLEEILRGVAAAIPTGWQYPRLCQARIICNGSEYGAPPPPPTAAVQRAAIRARGSEVGTVEVYYAEPVPPADEGPFLHEERKLLDTIAERLGSCILHRQLLSAMQGWRQAQQRASREATGDWSVIIDLLRRTDRSLLLRVARKLLNHLCWSGVRDAARLLERLRGNVPDVAAQVNEPEQRGTLALDDAAVDEVFQIAAAHRGDQEVVRLIHQWMKQDRASFLVNVLENTRTSLAQVADALQRYRFATQGEIELSGATLKGLRVALIHRLLTGQLEFVNVAKNYLDLTDFHELLQRVIHPAEGHGKIGGKGAGLVLAYKIVQRHGAEFGLEQVRMPRTWYLTSDGMYEFVHSNHLEDVLTHKYKEIEEIRQEYADIVQVFKHSRFPADLAAGLSVALDELGEHPLIVRSSSLLEDRFGAAFAGKYKSLFLPNRGTKAQRLQALTDAIAEVYASTFSPDAIEYRAERNLLDFSEGMAVLIQEVVGTEVGPYFLPLYAGVAFSNNEFRWSPRIKREDGLVRLVPGLGTRAVDRVGDDFPILCAPGQPGLRVNATPEEVVRYAPRYLDALNLQTGRFETVEIAHFLRQFGAQLPAVEMLVSVYRDGHLRQPLPGQLDFERDDLVVTFEGLLTRTPFVRQIRGLLNLLQDRLQTPVDIEFASDGRDLYLLQCRAQSRGRHDAPAPIPRDLPRDRVIFTANRYVSNGCLPAITHIVYVDPEAYSGLESVDRLLAVGRAVSRLNKLLPKRQFVLMGPGRWGSRGDIKLGVQVGYSDINNSALLIEIARRKGDYTPELSFGTHFFQDLVEAGIRYLPLYPDEEGVIFNEAFLKRSGNILPDLVPEFASLRDTVYVVDVPRATDGLVLRVLMNADLDEAVGVLAAPEIELTSPHVTQMPAFTSPDQDWRWRRRMAERLASQMDLERFGVQAVYLIGSVKNATAGPASDIDLLIHFRGTPQQRQTLELWLSGWSLCLAEMNYLRTGYKSDGLLDAHIITDEDIERRTSFAVKIGAVTDAALLLRSADGQTRRT